LILFLSSNAFTTNLIAFSSCVYLNPPIIYYHYNIVIYFFYNNIIILVIYIKKLFYLFFPLICGTIIGLLTSSSISYQALNKPPLSPPGFVFPIVWSILYLLMGLSYLLFKNNVSDALKESIIYYSQLIVNLLWSIFFFVLEWRLFSIFWTLLLLGLIIYLFILYIKKYKPSAYLLIPYIIWVTFATYLTIGTFILN